MTIGDILTLVKPQPTKRVLKALRAQGWHRLRDAKGSHEIWGNGQAGTKIVVPTGHRYISPGVLTQLERAGLSIPREWK